MKAALQADLKDITESYTRKPHREHLASAYVLIAPTEFMYPRFDGQPDAMREFKQCVRQLDERDIEVIPLYHPKPAATMPAMIYPNWFATYPCGALAVFQMAKGYRQNETTMLSHLESKLKMKYELTEVLDNRTVRTGVNVEKVGAKALEGTSVMIHDRRNQVMFMNRSYATDEELLEHHADRFGYSTLSFSSESEFICPGEPIYHTNIALSVGERFSVVASKDGAITEGREELLAALRGLGKEVIEVTIEQAEVHFCANILQVKNRQGKRFIIMSKTAHEGFTAVQLAALRRHGEFIVWEIPMIENGSGSARCMIQEIFLPVKPGAEGYRYDLGF